MSTAITVAFGDGIGPEIVEATLHVLREAGADLIIETIEIGQRVYDMEGKNGILPSSWESLLRTQLLLKAPTVPPPSAEYMDVTTAIRNKMTDTSLMLFTPPHGHEPELAGKNKANPTPMLQEAIRLLRHVGQDVSAALIEQALQQTLDDGIHTPDCYNRKTSNKKVGTQEFAEAIVERIYKIQRGY